MKTFSKAAFRAQVQVEREHYSPLRYLTPRRLAAMGHQFQLVCESFPRSEVLEIGGGNGITRQLMEAEGCRVLAADLDPALRPDVRLALPLLPFKDGAFDCILCCQVLEHIPWEACVETLREFHRVARHGAVISLPTTRLAIGLAVLGLGRDGHKMLSLPRLGKGSIRSPDEHYWELEAGVTTSEFRRAVSAAGFKIEKELRSIHMLYHHFFVLRKTRGR